MANEKRINVISVILPTYNRASFLERSLRSVFSQHLPCDEVIVVDDGSTDNSCALVEAMAGQAPCALRLLRQQNLGAAAARNAGIQAARGELLAFLDSDDWWLPRKLELQQAAMAATPDILISHTRELWFRHGQRVNQKKKHDPPGGDIFAASLRMCVVGMSTTMVRRELFARYGLFDETLPCCEDYDLWLRVGCREPFLRLPEALTAKDGGREDQLSTIHRLGMDVYRIRALCNLLDSGVLKPWQQRLAVDELARKCRIYAQGCYKHGRPDEGTRYQNLAAHYQLQPAVIS
nr:glycosyltransferase family A protein [uncultured Desulfobulbus sp.]